jgi:hypothetical protein
MVLRWIRSIPRRAHSQSLGRVNDRAAKPNNGYARSENILVLFGPLAAIGGLSVSGEKTAATFFVNTPNEKKPPTFRQSTEKA